MIATYIALVLAGIVAGGGGFALITKEPPPTVDADALVEAVAANTTAALAPLVAEQENLGAVLGAERLDGGCTVPEGRQVDAQYLLCQSMVCLQISAAQGQVASTMCAKPLEAGLAMGRCEVLEGAARLECFGGLK